MKINLLIFQMILFVCTWGEITVDFCLVKTKLIIQRIRQGDQEAKGKLAIKLTFSCIYC